MNPYGREMRNILMPTLIALAAACSGGSGDDTTGADATPELGRGDYVDSSPTWSIEYPCSADARDAGRVEDINDPIACTGTTFEGVPHDCVVGMSPFIVFDGGPAGCCFTTGSNTEIDPATTRFAVCD